MKTAIVQIKATSDKQKNVDKALRFAERAIKSRANFILFPELFVFRGKFSKKTAMHNVVEKIDGPTVEIFKAVARSNKVNILLGSIYEKTNNRNKAYNTSVYINKNGKVTATYRKNNLFSAKLKGDLISESNSFCKGSQLATCRVDGFRMGLSICYDLRFCEIYKEYARRGVDMVSIPSNFTHMTGKAHWEPLLRARAIETLSYVLAPNQMGIDNRGIKSYGHSMIISPWGEILARASGTKEEIIYATINQKDINRARRSLPNIAK